MSGACAAAAPAANLFVAVLVAVAAELLALLVLLLLMVQVSLMAGGCSGDDVLMVTPILPDSLDSTSAFRLVPTAGWSSSAVDGAAAADVDAEEFVLAELRDDEE